ncbi:complement resistance protein TraT [Thermodesulfobacterium hveragerdense]|uniref:complement resistance protein TraT n=1 Tax=Thermodesulfobacterium hveragerdense TaxID=53424 RepID=UPI000412913E|nr:complement resistance protein TraT [Thermodesulfobacterium hveragerdense]
MSVFKSKITKRVATFVTIGALSFQLFGCATLPEAIEYRELYTNYKMTDTIFLDVTKRAKYKNIFVDVRNTSQLQEIDTSLYKNAIEHKLQAKGYNVVQDPSIADYILQVNVVYFDYYRKTAAQDGALSGAVAGGLAGGLAGGRDVDALILAAIGAGVGYVGGALIGSALKIETFAGVVEIQIMEKTENPVVGVITSNLKQGTSTTIKTEQAITTNYQTYRTKLAVTATQTNLKKEIAAKEVVDKTSVLIANFF